MWKNDVIGNLRSKKQCAEVSDQLFVVVVVRHEDSRVVVPFGAPQCPFLRRLFRPCAAQNESQGVSDSSDTE